MNLHVFRDSVKFNRTVFDVVAVCGSGQWLGTIHITVATHG